MNSWIELELEKVLSRVEYSESSPSGLVWKENHGGIRKKMYKKGDVAGTMQGKAYSVGLFGKNYPCNRIVYWMHNPNENIDDYFIHNVDWNKSNNSIENLVKISVKEFRRLVINKRREDQDLPATEFLEKYEMSKKYREQNREKLKDTTDKWRQRNKIDIAVKNFEKKTKNKERVMWQSARERAKKFNLPFEITPSDIVIPKICPILGIPLIQGNGKAHANSPSLDRIIPELGYTPNNIQVISHKANTIKSNASMSELMVFCLWVMENYRDN